MFGSLTKFWKITFPPLNENAPFLFIESMYNVCVKNLKIVLLLRVQMRNIEMKREAEKLDCKDEKTKEKYRKKYIDINNNNNNNIKLPNWSGLSMSLQLSLEQNGPWHPGISSSGILSEF